MFDGRQFSTAELASAIEVTTSWPDYCPAIWPQSAGGASFSQVLGKALRKHVDTRYGNDNIRLEQSDKDTRSGSPRWRITVDLSAQAEGRRSPHTSTHMRKRQKPIGVNGQGTPATPLLLQTSKNHSRRTTSQPTA